MSFLGLVSALTLTLQGTAPIDPQRAAQVFREAEAMSKKDGGRLWGVPLYGPMMLVDATTNYAVANMPDKEGKLAKAGEVYVGTLPKDVAPANTAKVWSGVEWTMILWPLPELPRSRAPLAMHECYHRIQDELGLPGRDQAISHLDGKDGRTWLRLEMRALSEALQQSGDARLKAARDALDFRAARASLCGTDAAEAERILEMNEGLAEYTGLMLSGVAETALDTRAAIRLEQEQASASFARSFAYATGPAYARLLDGQRVGWRKGLTKDASLSELLRKSLNYQPQTGTGHLDARVEPYDGAFLMRQEIQRAEQNAARIAGFQKKYVDGPTLTLPVGNDFGYSFDPNNVFAFPGVGQVLPTAKVTSEWGVLEVTGGVLLKRNSQGLVTGVVVAAPTDPAALSGEGWKLTLSSGWKIVPGEKAGSFRLALSR